MPALDAYAGLLANVGPLLNAYVKGVKRSIQPVPSHRLPTEAPDDLWFNRDDIRISDGGVRRYFEITDGIDLVGNARGLLPPVYFTTWFLKPYLEVLSSDALSLNLLSVVSMCQAAVPEMREQGWGRVVAITSISVRQPLPMLILSNTARAGATGFLKTLATEVAPDGVTVNSLQPGIHRTRRVEEIYGGSIEAAAQGVPVGELGSADDFGQVAAFLCSDAARFITGASIPVDGGAYAGLQ